MQLRWTDVINREEFESDTDSACIVRSKKLENLTEKSRPLQHCCPWVGLTRGLGWVEVFQFLVG